MQEQPIDLRDLVEQVLKRRWLIIAVVVLCAGLSGVAGLLWPKSFEAVVVLVPAPDRSEGIGGAGSSLGSRLGGLAALAGLSTSSGGKEAESIAVLESETLTSKYIEENRLLPVLFEKQWDESRKAWKTAGDGDVPTLWLATQFFRKSVRKVERETDTGLVRVSVRWKDPQLAATWANGIVALANQYMRDKAIAEAERNIAYLKDQAQQTGIVEVRQAIYGLLEGELNKSMLARGTDEYAFKVIDPAVAPESPTKPAWWFFLAAGIVAGLLLGVFLALVQLAWDRPR